MGVFVANSGRVNLGCTDRRGSTRLVTTEVSTFNNVISITGGRSYSLFIVANSLFRGGCDVLGGSIRTVLGVLSGFGNAIVILPNGRSCCSLRAGA